jgi:hypothetical protein
MTFAILCQLAFGNIAIQENLYRGDEQGRAKRKFSFYLLYVLAIEIEELMFVRS